ncbi:MAG: hypothetical protein J1D88_08685 [Treponema sp.]|nr:hypothetical protein [Treponema sp.]
MANATIAKVNGKVHVTELDALSDAMEREYKLACGGGEGFGAERAFCAVDRLERTEHHGNQA